MAKLLLGAAQNLEPSTFDILKKESGAVFSPQSTLHFSFAHTRTHAAVALSYGHCGIDIENNDRQVNREQISKRFFTTDEHQRVVQDGSAFFKIWTAKEAFLKHEGTGIDRPLKDVRVSPTYKSVQYQSEIFPLYTQIQTTPKGSTVLSILGCENCREIKVDDLIKM